MTVISYAERSTASTSTSFPQGRSVTGRWFPRLLSAAAGFMERVHRQRMIAELHSLDDYLLKDIGIARCEIWYRVSHPQDR